MEIKGTQVLEKLINSNRRFILSVGSSRSSKTFSVYQWVLIYCLKNKNRGKTVSMIRRSFPSLKRSLLREFINYIDTMGLYSERKHNKSSQIIELFGCYVEFFSLDNYEKVKGAKRDVAYLNEITEIDYEPANQVFLRTTEKIIMDMNPSDTNHWVWNMKSRGDVDYIHSTYKDNPFLEEDVVKQIESYKDLDENYWRIYGLGLPGISTTTIFPNWTTWVDSDLEGKEILQTNWGLDIGFHNQSALCRVIETPDGFWVKEFLYKSKLITSELIQAISDLGITDLIWVDSARPDIIEDLKRVRVLAKGADKSVNQGILHLKSKKLYIHEDSDNLIDELKFYRWKSSGEVVLDEPVKIKDHLMDAMRYATYSSRLKQSKGVPFLLKGDDRKRYFN